jgi:hypothetical protein
MPHDAITQRTFVTSTRPPSAVKRPQDRLALRPSAPVPDLRPGLKSHPYTSGAQTGLPGLISAAPKPSSRAHSAGSL